ncbi:ubiquitin carboxyl-terminal hydrolase 26 [Nycticebus coucang]|uniref:ubiquitin carboxyl-terminal hydrolase 26 n=1 Tax=Nycticebus coucang TaxID=9470 RepID=UPI00234D780B|nr:ubiquitin carboxyl-terminal hydrolase 26 [Nycticebus coucang]
MAAVMMHAFVQLWSRKSGMSKSKEVFIETVEGKKKIKLVLYFNNGQYKIFRLSNNIKNVVLSSYGEKQNHLHLTFQNNSFLFIDKLSSPDAEQLKLFLDRVHENKIQPGKRPHMHMDVLASTTTEKEVHQTSFYKVLKKSRYLLAETGKGSEKPALQKIPLLMSKSSTPIYKGLLENLRKRKQMLSSKLEMNENTLKENITKDKRDALRYIRHKWEKQLKLLKFESLKGNKKLEFGSSATSNSFGNPDLGAAGLLQTLTEKTFLAFLIGPNKSLSGPEWEKLRLSFDLYPEKLWQGLPNLGNTCYMNSVLQCLFSIPSFADDLLYQSFPWNNIPLDALSMSLTQLLVLKDIYNIKVKEFLLLNIKKAISTVADMFSGNIQNDAHEFLGHCFDQLKESLGRCNTVWKTTSELQEENSPPEIRTDEDATKELFCPVNSNFEFELLRSIVCSACGHVVLKTELNNYLSINLPQGPIRSSSSIQSNFDLFFEAEELDYNCGKCKHKVSVGEHKFSRLPRVLIVHLKRYTFNELWSLMKDDQEVIVSEYLNLTAHCSESTKPPLPLNKIVHTRDCGVLKLFQKMNPGSLSSLTSSIKLTLECKDSLAQHIRSDESGSGWVFKRASRQEGKELMKMAKQNIMQSKLLRLKQKALIERELLASSMMYLGDTSFSQMFQRDRGEFTSSSDTGDVHVAKDHSEEVSEDPKKKKYKQTDMFGGFDRVTELIENFHENHKAGIPEEIENFDEETLLCDEIMIYDEVLEPEQAPLGTFPDLVPQSHTEDSSPPTKVKLQEGTVTSSEQVLPGSFKQLVPQSHTEDSSPPTKVNFQEDIVMSPGPQQAPLGSFTKLVLQSHTEDCSPPTKLNLQEGIVMSQGVLDSNQNPGKKGILDKKTESEATEPKRNDNKDDRYTYRLIGIVNHLGKTPNSGHYLSDAYDFDRQVWFTYNDMQVSNIQEALMQETRLSTGYIFFYMHNKIFEDLLKRPKNSQVPSKEKGMTPQEK